jgi:hypothetical protein
VGSRWFSRRAIGLHLTLAVVVPTFVLLFLWQVRRATGGNELSWAYVFEWPFFTGYAVYMWWKLLHEAPDARPLEGPPVRKAGTDVSEHSEHSEQAISVVPPDWGEQAANPAAGSAAVSARVPEDAGEDEELAAYNRYLAELNASGRRKRW